MNLSDFEELDAWNDLAWKSGETPNELECSRCGKLVGPSSIDYEQVCDECNGETVPEPNLSGGELSEIEPRPADPPSQPLSDRRHIASRIAEKYNA